MEPLSLATHLRKLLLWLTLACEKIQVFESRSIGRVGSFTQNDRNEWGSLKMGVASKILRALHTQQYIRKPLQGILDPLLENLSGL